MENFILQNEYLTQIAKTQCSPAFTKLDTFVSLLPDCFLSGWQTQYFFSKANFLQKKNGHYMLIVELP